MRHIISKIGKKLLGRNKNKTTSSYTCQICKRTVSEKNALTHIKTEEYLLHLIEKDHPEWDHNKEICQKCVDYYRELIKKAKI